MRKIALILFLSFTALISVAQVVVSTGYAMGRFNNKYLNRFRDSFDSHIRPADSFSGPGLGGGMAIHVDYVNDFFLAGAFTTSTSSESSAGYAGGGELCLLSKQRRSGVRAGITTGYDKRLVSSFFASFGIQKERVKIFHRYSDGVISYGKENPFNGVYNGTVTMSAGIGAMGDYQLAKHLSLFGSIEFSLAFFRLGTYYTDGNYSKSLANNSYYPLGIPTDVEGYFADPYTYSSTGPYAVDGLNGMTITAGLRILISDM